METFKERMARIRDRAGFESQADAAEAIGCKRGTVGMWEADSSDVQALGGKYLLAAAAAYKVRPDWINNLKSMNDGYPWRPEGEPFSAPIPSSETPAGYVRFQLLQGAAGMGQGIVNDDYPEVIREVDIAAWEVRRKIGFLPAPGRMRLITGRGVSMRPMIDNGDVVMIDTSVTHFDGDAVYVINVGGETQIKMLQMRGDGLYVVSANSDYPPYLLTPEHRSDGLHIGGRVSAVMGIKEL